MGQSYIGEIRMFGGNFPPNGWLFCQGQMLQIAQYDTLFNLIGTTYGGDGQQTFALPNLSSRIPVHKGQGPGLPTTYTLGQTGGAETVTLTSQQLPTHTHTLRASTDPGNASAPTNNVLATLVSVTPYLQDVGAVQLNAGSLKAQGGSQAHDNMIPFMCVNFIISLFGVYPTQS